MKVDLGSLEVDDYFRLALAEKHGLKGLAGRTLTRDWARFLIENEVLRVKASGFQQLTIDDEPVLVDGSGGAVE